MPAHLGTRLSGWFRFAVGTVGFALAASACGSSPTVRSAGVTAAASASTGQCRALRLVAAPFVDVGPVRPGAPAARLAVTAYDLDERLVSGVRVSFVVHGKTTGTAVTDASGMAYSAPDGVSADGDTWMAIHQADAYCHAAASASYVKQP